MEENEAALKIQGMFKTSRARRNFRILLQSSLEKVYDADSGVYYYYNRVTGESSWDKPKALGDLDVEEMSYEEAKAESKEEREEFYTDDKQDVEYDDEKKQESSEEEEEEELKAHNFTKEELVIIKQQFVSFDDDKSGSINAKELLQLMRSLGEDIDIKAVLKLIKEVDDNDNGEVEYPEFVEILHRQREKSAYCPSLHLALVFGPEELKNIRKQFQSLDEDGSGEIDKEELGKLIHTLGHKHQEFDLDAIIAEVDDDNNGMINFKEFVHIVYNMRNSENQSAFGKLLKSGITSGLFLELADVMTSTKNRFTSLFNPGSVAREKEYQEELERLEQEKKQKLAQRKADLALFQKRKLEHLEEMQYRFREVEGYSHEVLLEGDMETYAKKGQYARVHYVGKFTDGREFESSRKRGTAFEFQVGGGHVIPGWEIAILRMSEGESALIKLAPTLAYGHKGRAPVIPPNETLVFKIELIELHTVERHVGEEDEFLD